MVSIAEWINHITGWGYSAYSCSPQSHALAYSIVVMAVAISTGGVIVWKRYIRTQPVAAQNSIFQPRSN